MNPLLKAATLASLYACLFSSLVQAGIEFKSKLIESHAAADAESVYGDYHFKITGDKPIEIEKMDVYCSCLKAQINGDGKLIWKPGESGTIRGVFSKLGNFKGTVDKDIKIYLKGDPKDKPSVNLVFRVHVPVLFEIGQKTNRWTVGAELTEQVIDLTVKSEEPMQVTGIEGTNENFEFAIKTVEEGRKYQLTVRPKSTAVPAYGIIRIMTDCPIPRHAKHQLFCVITKSKKTPQPAK